MKKTVWATGLFAALVATGAWSLPLDQPLGQPNATTFRDVAMNSFYSTATTETNLRLSGLPDMELVERGIFECIYHSNEMTSLNKVLIRGTDSCGFLDDSEIPEEKRQRIAGYVNAYLPGVFQPEKTSCFAIQSRVEDEFRKTPLSKYIEQMDQLPLSQDERGQLQGKHLENAIEAENTIKTELQGETHYGKTRYSEQTCEMLLVAENESAQAGAGFRSCARSCMNGVGMLVTKLGSAGLSALGWVWFGGKKAFVPFIGGWSVNWVTTTPVFKAGRDEFLYGDFGPNVTRHAGGFTGFWNTEITTTAIGTSNTVGDYAAAFSTAGLIFFRAKVIAALSAVHHYALSREAVLLPVKVD